MKATDQTPQKPQKPRSIESTNRRSKDVLLKRGDSQEPVKKPQKTIGRSLSSAFIAISEDHSAESIDSSPESEIFYDKEPSELQSFVLSPDLALSASSENFEASNFFSSLKIIEDEQEISDITVECNGSGELDGLKTGNVDVQVVQDFLREARFQISNTSHVDLRSKKILDALIAIAIEDFYGLPEERGQFSGLVSAKVRIGIICLLLWIVSVSVLLFSYSGSRTSFPDPPPT